MMNVAPPPPQATTTPMSTDRPPKQLKASLASLDISSPQSLALSDIDDSNRDASAGGSSTDEENVMNYAEFDPVQLGGEHGTGNNMEGCDGVPVLDVVGGEGGSVQDGGDGPPFDDDDDVESLGFPPGHVVHISDVSKLSRRRDSPPVSSVNPSILPTYFFCPLTGYMMTDPVVTPSGTTYERRAVLRHLVLRPGRDPLDGRPLRHEELEEDRMVRRAIDKARKEAWIRYVADFDGGPGGAVAGEVDAVRGAAAAGQSIGMEGEEDANVTYPSDGLEEAMLRTDPSGDELISIGEGEARRASGIIIDDDGEYEDLAGSPSPETIRGGPPRSPLQSPRPAPEKDIVAVHDSSSRSSVHSTLSNGMGNHDDVTGSLAGHGWSVPLGVHRITAPGGLVVTQDVHRRSGVVQRRVVRRSLADAGGGGGHRGDGGRSRKKIKMRRLRPRKQRHDRGELRTVESVLTSDLVLPEGSHVEVTETRVHGGRVRGHVVWEEEVAARIDPELALRLEEEAVRRRAAAPPPPANPGARRGSMKKLRSFKRMNSGGGGSFKRRSTAGSAGSGVGPSNPFTQDLFDRPPTHGASVSGGPGGVGDADGDDAADEPIETVVYRGWVSLCWVGGPANHDRDETVRRTRRRRRGGTAVGEAAPAADEDEGPWTSPLALGVYRVVSHPGQPRGPGPPLLPLHDTAGGGEIVDHLGPGRCFEVVETQVVLARGRGHRGAGAAPPPAVRRVRARCMVPTLRRRVVGAGGSGPASSDGLVDEVVSGFQGGWITLHDGHGSGSASAPSASASAAPVPLGAYVVAGPGPLASTDAGGRTVKGTLPAGSVMEVDTTRIEFADDVGDAAAGDGGEGGGPPARTGRVAVRALIASGGYVTLFTCPADPAAGAVGASDPPDVRAEPVPLGTYRVVSSTGLTQGIGHGTRLLAELRTNAFVRAVETRVENGCVRGRIDAVLFEQSDGGVVRDTIAGWVNLFQPPSYRWAELSSVESGAR